MRQHEKELKDLWFNSTKNSLLPTNSYLAKDIQLMVAAWVDIQLDWVDQKKEAFTENAVAPLSFYHKFKELAKDTSLSSTTQSSIAACVAAISKGSSQDFVHYANCAKQLKREFKLIEKQITVWQEEAHRYHKEHLLDFLKKPSV